MTTHVVHVPEAGQAVLVRGRPAAVRDVSAHPGSDGAVHLVDVEYLDGWDFPPDDRLVWERERGARVLTASTLPDPGDLTRSPDLPCRLRAFCDALRWSSITRLPGLIEGDQELISPWEGAVAVETYQLVPALRALEMPRVSLLIADDVGLGKTIEAGLILAELTARRRIRRVLILVPASLQLQWRDEMKEKFGFDFRVMDRDAVYAIQREYGMDTNPWAVTPRAITSMDFLRQPDVQDQFLAAARNLERGPLLAWDLLIVDEAHNFSPLSFAERTERTRMLAEIAPHFEHRLFLTATPHNGYTASFTGLLELLDPVRFRQTAEMGEPYRRQLSTVMVRRLKSELNDRAAREGRPRPFPLRDVQARPFSWTPREQALADALRAYRQGGNNLIASLARRERRVGRFVFTLLTKRLLSSPYAFARTWWHHVAGTGAEPADLSEMDTVRRRAEQPTADDVEKALREEEAARRGASWLARYGEALAPARDRVSAALTDLGWGPATRDVAAATSLPEDGKWNALTAWIEETLLVGGRLRDDERAIVFTEYKDTQDYLLRRLALAGYDAPQVHFLFGGSPLGEREEVKEAFNDPADPLRLLVATDVASEGLNLQTSCRYVFHYEIPWNPMRLEQRNGRVDRHGQPRDVVAFHFTSSEDADVEFLDRVVRKVTQVREDLGSVGEVIDDSVADHFISGMGADEMERRVDVARDQAPAHDDLPPPSPDDPYLEVAERRFTDTGRRLRLTPERLAGLLGEAAALQGGSLKLARDGMYRFDAVPVAWRRLVAETIRVRRPGQAGALPYLAFDAAAFIARMGDREVFRPRPDAVLLRLRHPLLRRAVGELRRLLWDDPSRRLARWTIGEHEGLDEPVLAVHCLLQVVNDLREPVHSELVSYAFDRTGAPLPDVPSSEGRALAAPAVDAWRRWLSGAWDEIREQISGRLAAEAETLHARASDLLGNLMVAERERTRAAFEERFRELERDPGERTREKLRRELERAERQAMQLTFDPEENRRRQARVSELQTRLEETEWQRMREQHRRLHARLEAERDRLLDQVLPRRFSLARLDLAPVAVELAVPAGAMP